MQARDSRPRGRQCRPGSWNPNSRSRARLVQLAVPRMAHARATRLTEPSAAIGSRSRMCSREAGAAVVVERHAIGGRGRLATEEGGPVVLEVAEHRRHVDRSRCHVGEAGIALQVLESVPQADREARTLVERFGSGVEGDRGVPEVTHELHASGVVPHIRGDNPGGRDHRQSTHRGRRVGHEVEHEPGNDGVERPVGKMGRVADLKPGPRVGDMTLRPRQVPLGWIDTDAWPT